MGNLPAGDNKMSRSFKKFPVVKDWKRETGTQFKKFTNRKIRRSNFDALPLKGSRFKNQYGNQYDRCDIRYFETYRSYLEKQRIAYLRYGNYKWLSRFHNEASFQDTPENYYKWKRFYINK